MECRGNIVPGMFYKIVHNIIWGLLIVNISSIHGWTKQQPAWKHSLWRGLTWTLIIWFHRNLTRRSWRVNLRISNCLLLTNQIEKMITFVPWVRWGCIGSRSQVRDRRNLFFFFVDDILYFNVHYQSEYNNMLVWLNI